LAYRKGVAHKTRNSWRSLCVWPLYLAIGHGAESLLVLEAGNDGARFQHDVFLHMLMKFGHTRTPKQNRSKRTGRRKENS
jgi:hypothetical protein